MRARWLVLLGLSSRVASAEVPPPIFPPPAHTPPAATTPTGPRTPPAAPSAPSTPSTPPATTPPATTPPATTATAPMPTVTAAPATPSIARPAAASPTTDKPAITDEEEGPPKLSMPTEADRLAWRHPGFRLGLGLTYGEFHGLRGAPSGRLLGPKLRVGLRLDETWSLIASFEYTSASRSPNGLAGLRFAGTLDPTWHVTPSLSLAVGFGFGGIVEGGSTRMDPPPLHVESTYTFPDASHPIASCSGVGAAALARGEYAYVLGPRAALTVAAEAVGQWTGCVDDTGRVEPDTGQTIERHQWWPHVGATLTVGIAWR